jgi:hypothetical protein
MTNQHTTMVEDLSQLDLQSHQSVEAPNAPNASTTMEITTASSTGQFSKGALFRKINQKLATNHLGIPDYIYRADLLPANLVDYSLKAQGQLLSAAAVPLTFEHGYPAFDEHTPFWSQFPYEPPDAFDAFIQFLELPEKSRSENPVRLLPSIALLVDIPLEEVIEWCHLYYWHFRARAYDLFIITCRQKQREQRMLTMEGAHYDLAERALQKVTRMLDKKLDQVLATMGTDDEMFDETKLKDLTNITDTLVRIQRVSQGLPATGPLAANLGGALAPKHSTVEDSMRHINKTSATTDGNGDGHGGLSAEMDEVLQDPEMLETLQDLITRTQTNRIGNK